MIIFCVHNKLTNQNKSIFSEKVQVKFFLFELDSTFFEKKNYSL
jgi:hypothetical protein